MKDALAFFFPILAGIEALVIAALLLRRAPLRAMWRKMMDSLVNERRKLEVLERENEMLRAQINFLDAKLREAKADNANLVEQLYGLQTTEIELQLEQP